MNGYSRSDWLLKFLYRTVNLTFNVAGLTGVNVPLVENVDLTGVVNGHFQYPNKLGHIFYLMQVRRHSSENRPGIAPVDTIDPDAAASPENTNAEEPTPKVEGVQEAEKVVEVENAPEEEPSSSAPVEVVEQDKPADNTT